MPAGRSSWPVERRVAVRSPTGTKEDPLAPAASTKPADTLRVPAAMLPLVEPMNRWIDAFCDAYLDEEYAYLSKKMLAKLARKRPSPLERGDPVIWAASVVYTVGRVNFLDDPTQTPHLTLDQFSEASEVTKSSLSRRPAPSPRPSTPASSTPSTAGGPWPRRVPRRGWSRWTASSSMPGCCPPSYRRKPGAWA